MYDVIKEAYRLGYAIVYLNDNMQELREKYLTDLSYNFFMIVPPVREFISEISDEELIQRDGLCPNFMGRRFTMSKLSELGKPERVLIDPLVKIPDRIDNEYCRFRYAVMRGICKGELIKVLMNNREIVRMEQIFRLCKKVSSEQVKNYQLWNDVDLVKEVEYRAAEIQIRCLQTLAKSDSGADARFVYMALASESEKKSLVSKGGDDDMQAGSINNTQEIYNADDLKELNDRLNRMGNNGR